MHITLDHTKDNVIGTLDLAINECESSVVVWRPGLFSSDGISDKLLATPIKGYNLESIEGHI